MRKEDEIDEADLADTVAAFYDGATSPELWSAAGERLSRLLDARVGVSRVGTVPAGLGELVFYNGPTPSSPPEYAEYYRTIDPYLAVARAPLPVDARFGMLGQEVLDQRAYQRSEFYTDFGRALGLGHLLGARNQFSDGALATLGLYRPETMDPFGEAERRVAAALVPHLWRALELRQRLRPRLDAMAALGALDTLAQAVIVVDAASRVTFANAAAARLADAADGGLRLVRLGPASHGGLVLSAAHRDDAATLAKTVGAVARLGSAGGTLRLRRGRRRGSISACRAGVPSAGSAVRAGRPTRRGTWPGAGDRHRPIAARSAQHRDAVRGVRPQSRRGRRGVRACRRSLGGGGGPSTRHRP